MREYAVWARTKVHRRRVERARDILLDAHRRDPPLAVMTSWGKDSIALCDLSLTTLGRVPLVHLASPYALPGYEATIAHFCARTQVLECPASRSLAEYIEWCQRIGLPHERDRNAHKRAVVSIKGDVGDALAEEHGWRTIALGMRIAEGGPRAHVLRKRGPTYCVASGVVKTNPLAYWETRDVWAHIVAHDLPYPALYDAETHGQTRETIRNTGWLSTDGAERGRLVWLRAHYPEQWEALAAAFPHIVALS